MNYDIGPYDPCPCGSGKKYKFCCAAAAKQNRHGKFPVGTIAYYGPDDTVTTKIAAGVTLREGIDPIIERWHGHGVKDDPKVAEEIKRFFAKHGVKTVASSGGNMGCPHEEGIDFPNGQDCPMCPFWAGKQGSTRRYLPEDDYEDEEEIDEEGADQVPSDPSAGVTADDADGGEEEGLTQEEQDFNAQFERVEAIIGNPDLPHDEALDVLCTHLKAALQLPCEVTGIEDFQWEEPYVVGGWDPREYRQLKQTQPSYRDRYRLLGVSRTWRSRWALYYGDIIAQVQRISDSREFYLGLSELKCTDRKCPNHQLLNDYSVWFANSR